MRKNNCSGRHFPECVVQLVLSLFLAPKILQDAKFWAPTHLLSEVTNPPNPKEKVPDGTQKVSDLDFVKPLCVRLFNANTQRIKGAPKKESKTSVSETLWVSSRKSPLFLTPETQSDARKFNILGVKFPGTFFAGNSCIHVDERQENQPQIPK